MDFRFMASVSAVIAAVLAVMYLVFPGLVTWIFGLGDGGEVADFLSRRAGVLFLGFSVVLWSARQAQPGPARRAICLGAAVLTAVFAGLGAVEALRGFAHGLTWVVVALEMLLAVGFGRLLLRGE